jgi:CHAD domain-containing protein
LVPVAAFTGRRSTVLLADPAGPLRAELRLGRLRAVAAEREVARLLLAGPAAAVLALAGRLAEDLPLLPAAAALAEEGRALARGELPRPRRRGAPTLAAAPDVEAGFAAALGHLLEVLLQEAPRCRLEAGPEGVHQMRVALRRLRSVLRACRPAVGGPGTAALDDELKRLAQLLGTARDWDVFLAGLGAEVAEALPGEKRIAGLLRAAEARRHAGYRALRAELDGPGFRRLLLTGMALLAQQGWRPAADDPAAADRMARLALPMAEFGATLLDRRWHRLRTEGEAVESLSAEALHELRLTAKRLRYAAEIFGPIWPGKPQRRFLRRLAAVQEALGIANDTAVARALVGSLAGLPGPVVAPWAIGAVEGFATARLAPAREASLAAWEKLMLAKPFWSDV